VPRGLVSTRSLAPCLDVAHVLRGAAIVRWCLSDEFRISHGRPWPPYPQANGRSMRTTGTVKFFNSAKGFGFITPDEGGKDVFVHATAVEAAGMRALNEGDRVSFELEDDRRGRGKQAAQLQKA
jgi:cold shock protein